MRWPGNACWGKDRHPDRSAGSAGGSSEFGVQFLDFLGLGVPASTASLGELLAQGKANLDAWWITLSTFGVLVGTLMLLIFIGEALRTALDMVNSSRFGLQASIFTTSLGNAFLAIEELEVGGVVVNEVPGYRSDTMPYGGVKQSGTGREGIRHAMADMTEPRALVIRRT
jgi:hypothetical protein